MEFKFMRNLHPKTKFKILDVRWIKSKEQYGFSSRATKDISDPTGTK